MRSCVDDGVHPVSNTQIITLVTANRPIRLCGLIVFSGLMNCGRIDAGTLPGTVAPHLPCSFLTAWVSGANHVGHYSQDTDEATAEQRSLKMSERGFSLELVYPRFSGVSVKQVSDKTGAVHIGSAEQQRVILLALSLKSLGYASHPFAHLLVCVAAPPLFSWPKLQICW